MTCGFRFLEGSNAASKMCTSVVSLLFLLGLSLALQPGLEYRYQYRGILATGIIEKRHQLAAVGIEMDVTVQMAADLNITMKFDKIKVGDFHDDHSCDLRRPLPISYENLSEGRELLQSPFLVSLNGKDESYMDVPMDEPIWMTNIRKTVVGTFPFSTLWEEMKKREDGIPRPNFEIEEELIGGRCMSWYTVMQIPELDAAIIIDEGASELEEDVQRETTASSSSHKSSSDQTDTDVPDLQDDLWIVTRTVDYDMCSLPVEVSFNGNKESEALTERTSVSRYIMRGDNQGIRLETAIVEGAISVFTGSSDSQFHIDTLTNQTLQLRAVTVPRNKMSIDHATKRIRTWHYEGDSMRFQDDECHDQYSHFEEELLGVRAEGDDFVALKDKILSSLNELSTPPNNLVTSMDTVVQIVSYFSYAEIDSLYEMLQKKVLSKEEGETLSAQQNVENFKMALVLGGTEPAIRYLLDLLEDDVARRSDDFVFFFFKQIGMTLKAPNLIPRILQLATFMSWESGEDLAKTLALTTAASLYGKERRVTKFKNTATRDETCTMEELAAFFIPYLEEGIQNVSRVTWQRVIYIQALINTETTYTLEILHPIILGIEDEPVYLRTTAIAALSSHLLPDTASEMVFNLLTPLMENTGETPDVRGMAFLVLASWHPGHSWWKRMALSTWHEPSLRFANLVSSTIEGIANSDGERKEMMSRIAYLAKPAKGSSISLSTSFYLDNWKDLSLVWFANTGGIIPTHIFINYEIQRLRGFSSAMKIAMSQDGMDFFLELLKQYRDQFWYGDGRPAGGRSLVVRAFDYIMELGVNVKGFATSAEWFLKSGDHFLHAKTVEFFQGRMIFGFIREFQRYIPQVLDKLRYDKSIDTTYAYPTDLGIPFIVQYSSQKGYRLTSSTEPLQDSDSFSSLNRKGNFNFIFQFNQETAISTKSLVPWSEVSVGTGIRSDMNINLPVEAHFAGLFQTYQGLLKIILPRNDVHMISTSNHPYTALHKGLFHTNSLKEVKHINRTVGEGVQDNNRVMPWTGIWIESCYSGETESPDLPYAWSDLLRFLTPSQENWDYRLTYEVGATDTKEVSFSLTYGKNRPEPADSAPFFYPVPDYSTEKPEDAPKEGVEKEAKATLDLIKQLQEEETGDIKTIGINIGTSGSVDLTHRLLAMLIENDSLERRDTRLKLFLYSAVPMGLTSHTLMTCFEAGFQRPDFLPLTSVEEILNKNLNSHLSGKFWSGRSCEAENIIFDIKGDVKVSRKQINFVRDELEKGCEYNPEFPMKDIITSQLYDTVTLQGTCAEHIQEPGKTIMDLLYDWTIGRNPPRIRHYSEGPRPRSRNTRIRAKKDIESNVWEINMNLPSEMVIYRLPVPPFLGFPASSGQTLAHRVFNGRNPGICAVSSDKVHTFDGVEFPLEASRCWSLAALDWLTTSIQIYVRHSGEWEAKVLWIDRGLEFDLSSSSLKVNDEAPSETSETHRFVSLDKAVLLILNIGIVVKVSNKVEIEMPFSFRSSVVGLCGKFDGERQLEFLGPKFCDYSYHDIFASAWELAGADGCDSVDLAAKREILKDYQSTCTNASYAPSGDLYRNGQIDCTSWEYQVRTEGSCSCTALALTPTCKSGCTSKKKAQKQIQFSCIASTEHKSKDAKCGSQMYEVTYPTNCRSE
ncbi:hemolymph clottable protein-like [Palaemon carinicauda]|uniref:hemolymph clottable protein-like n=1 Tax=Palaemon carinicauda TaxID=392227 RepID=UPI0035B68FA3